MDLIPHGTEGGYTNWACRCWNCTDAHRVAAAATRVRLQAKPIPDHLHGKASTYTNRGCRCPACTEAKNITYRRWVAQVRGVA